TRPEMALRHALRRQGLVGYRCHPKGLPGKPDVAFTRWRLAIFVDGCFWHGHPDHFQPGTLGDYWDQKIHRTQERDRVQEAALREAGWEVLRFWDFEVKESPENCAERVGDTLARLRQARQE
ncbi:MAG TPA: very short patch repair endonuclease, partial [Solirubrobacterales bacterium]|nr:very short patch repair endonuclease [Solirubrobacterales bacterium]